MTPTKRPSENAGERYAHRVTAVKSEYAFTEMFRLGLWILRSGQIFEDAAKVFVGHIAIEFAVDDKAWG